MFVLVVECGRRGPQDDSYDYFLPMTICKLSTGRLNIPLKDYKYLECPGIVELFADNQDLVIAPAKRGQIFEVGTVGYARISFRTNLTITLVHPGRYEVERSTSKELGCRILRVKNIIVPRNLGFTTLHALKIKLLRSLLDWNYTGGSVLDKSTYLERRCHARKLRMYRMTLSRLLKHNTSRV